MSLAASSTAPRMTLDKTPCNNIGKAEDQPCNVTDDNLKTDCYESMHAFKKIRTSTSGLRKSPNKWTKEENQKLAALVAHYGEKKWKRISAEMGGQKTGAQCAQHWKRVLSPEIRKGHWDENEEDLLLRLVVQYGSCWKKIAKKIPQRTDIQCRYQYLKAKQSREVKWDAKEDESLIKKVMEMANCTFFKFVNDGSSCTTINSYDTPTNGYANSLAGSTNSMTSPMSLSSVINNNKENENDNHVARTNGFRLSSSVNSDLSDDRSSLRSSGGSSSGGSSGSETDTKDTDVSMSDSTSDLRSSSSSISGSGIMMEKDGASCHPAPTTSFNNNLGMAMHKVVWLEIAEHMARMKLTSTLRTALECKTRFLELVGNISVSGSPTNGQDSKPFDLKSSGGINAPSESRNAASHSSPSFLHRTPSSGGTSPNDTNINININNASDHNNNHISITNFSRNITINITNSPTNSTRSPHNNTNNAYNPRPHSSPSHPHNPNNINGTIVKTESTSSSMETSPTTNTRTSTSTSTSTTTAATTSATTSTNSSTNNNMPNAPSFPSFPPHFSPVAQPLAATAKPARSNSNSNNNNNNNNNSNSNSNSTSNNGSNNNNNGNGMMNMNGLDSLAAVASILPRELLADYAQF